VVKADVYGLGARQIVPALLAAGCATFFVALPREGIVVRNVAAKARIFVLGGLFNRKAAAACVEAGLVPVLNSQDEIAVWTEASKDGPYRSAIHVDTGMNRLGLTMAEALRLAHDKVALQTSAPVLIMSHLACADEPEHSKNREQLESFRQIRTAFGEIESSLANSAGIFLGPEYRFALTRPGLALYGGQPVNGVKHPLRTVATLELRIAQIRHAKAGETVSYGATETAWT
jgi:alanine racemase